MRNLRAAQEGTLRPGLRAEAFHATEIPDSDQPPVLRAYLKCWKMEVGVFFDGFASGAEDAELQRMAPNHPAFGVHANAT